MGDAHDLATLGKGPQPLADRARRLTADAGVDLVEYERGATGSAGRREQREHRARHLATRCGLAQRRRRHPRVRRDSELDTLAARGAELVALLDRHLERRVLHRE